VQLQTPLTCSPKILLLSVKVNLLQKLHGIKYGIIGRCINSSHIGWDSDMLYCNSTIHRNGWIYKLTLGSWQELYYNSCGYYTAIVHHTLGHSASLSAEVFPYRQCMQLLNKLSSFLSLWSFLNILLPIILSSVLWYKGWELIDGPVLVDYLLSKTIVQESCKVLGIPIPLSAIFNYTLGEIYWPPMQFICFPK